MLKRQCLGRHQHRESGKDGEWRLKSPKVTLRHHGWSQGVGEALVEWARKMSRHRSDITMGPRQRLTIEMLELAGTGQKTRTESPVQMFLW